MKSTMGMPTAASMAPRGRRLGVAPRHARRATATRRRRRLILTNKTLLRPRSVRPGVRGAFLRGTSHSRGALHHGWRPRGRTGTGPTKQPSRGQDGRRCHPGAVRRGQRNYGVHRKNRLGETPSPSAEFSAESSARRCPRREEPPVETEQSGIWTTDFVSIDGTSETERRRRRRRRRRELRRARTTSSSIHTRPR